MILLPDVSRTIAQAEGYQGEDLDSRISRLADAVFSEALEPRRIEIVLAAYCRRKIDRILKKIDLSDAKSAEEIDIVYKERTSSLDVLAIHEAQSAKISEAVAAKDLAELLAIYDDKNLIHLAASHLKSCKLDSFRGWLSRALRNEEETDFTIALKAHLPTVEPS